jgi:hypothetical protein
MAYTKTKVNKPIKGRYLVLAFQEPDSNIYQGELSVNIVVPRSREKLFRLLRLPFELSEEGFEFDVLGSEEVEYREQLKTGYAPFKTPGEEFSNTRLQFLSIVLDQVVPSLQRRLVVEDPLERVLKKGSTTISRFVNSHQWSDRLKREDILGPGVNVYHLHGRDTKCQFKIIPELVGRESVEELVLNHAQVFYTPMGARKVNPKRR